MKILIVAKAGNRNTFVLNLKDSLSTFAQVDSSIDGFWNGSKDYDIIHFQWPELLSFMISRRSFSPNKYRLKKITSRLKYWKEKGTKLVITRHNIFPHHSSSNYEKLYKIIYQHVDGVIHLDSFSQDDFFMRYPSFNTKHAIIPHGWYDNITNDCTEKEARLFLKLSDQTFVVLAFGAIRNQAEEQMLFESFDKLPMKNKILLIPRGYFSNENLIYRLMNFLNLKAYQHILSSKAKKLAKKGILWSQSFVPENHIQYYFNAADILIIPRINTLNSGNVPLGYTFKKVVVGPNTGNIGSILEETSNPTFDPTNIDSITNAMLMGQKLSKKMWGEENYQFAKKYWSWKDIGNQHHSFFQEILSQ